MVILLWNTLKIVLLLKVERVESLNVEAMRVIQSDNISLLIHLVDTISAWIE